MRKFLVPVIAVIFIFLILEAIIQAIYDFFHGRRLAHKLKHNPKSALRIINDSDLYDEKNIKHLIKLAEETGNVDAMLILKVYYSKKKTQEDTDKSNYWLECAAHAGDKDSIMEFYGFSDYDVVSTRYDEILCDLEKIKIASQAEGCAADYLKGIVYYKARQTDKAEQLFTGITRYGDSKQVDDSNYMLVLCLIKDSQIAVASNMLAYLENSGFKIPAQGYYAMYEYYAGQNFSSDICKEEIFYFDKYSACEDADKDSARRMGQNIYYSMGEALCNGKNGFEKDVRKALEMYEKAVEFKSSEAALRAGTLYMGSEYRDYKKANDYLRFSAFNGNEEAAAVLAKYGVDDILVVTPDFTEGNTYQFIGGVRLTVPKETLEWIVLCKAMGYKTGILGDSFCEEYSRRITDFDDLVKKIHGIYCQEIAEMLQWCIQLMMSIGIDMYDAQDIIAECADLSLLPRVPDFDKAIERIDDRAEQLHLEAAYAKATRTSWVGVGFGTTIQETISSAVRSSVAAGVMNIGSGILQSVGDSLAKEMDNSELRSMGKKVYKNPNTLREFKNAVISACNDISDTVMNIIGNNANVNLEPLEGVVRYRNEDISYIDDRSLDAKINNNSLVGNTEYVYALLLERLRRNPVDAETIHRLTDITLDRSGRDSTEYKEMLRYARNSAIE